MSRVPGRSGAPTGRVLYILAVLSSVALVVCSAVLVYTAMARRSSSLLLWPSAGTNATSTSLAEAGSLAGIKQNQQQQKQKQQQQRQKKEKQQRAPPVGSSLGGFGVPAYTVHGRADADPLRWPAGGFVEVEVEHSIPQVDPKYTGMPGSCFEIAAKVEQPYNELYRRRGAPPTDLPGGLPRTFFRWENGNISRAEFDAVPPKLPRGPNCVHCGPAIRYQIFEKHLYRKGGIPNWLVEVGEDLLLAALHLWDLPDMDFIIHYDDSCPPGVPVLSWNICRNKPKAGFAYPSYTAWTFSLGPEQLRVYHQCLISRFPVEARRPVVFWRGGTTDPLRPDFQIRVVDKVARMVIHKRYADDKVVDAKLSKIIFADDCTKQYLEPLAPRAELEDYNQAALIMDVDGNGWSDRLSRMVHFPGATFKQASNHTAFFEHLLAPGHAAEYFENDLSDLTARAYALVAEWNTSTARIMKLAEQKQGVGAAFMHQVAVAEAAAYALMQYQKYVSWPFERDKSYEHVPFSKACVGWGAKLPPALCTEIRARPAHTPP